MMSDCTQIPLWLKHPDLLNCSTKDLPDLMSNLDCAPRNGIPPHQPFISCFSLKAHLTTHITELANHYLCDTTHLSATLKVGFHKALTDILKPKQQSIDLSKQELPEIMGNSQSIAGAAFGLHNPCRRPSEA